MIINLTYIFIILIGIYFGVITYIATRKREIFLVIAIFVGSLLLEFHRLNNADYKLGLNDVFWTSRDILRTLVMIYFFQFLRNNFAYQDISPSPKKKIAKTNKKK